MKVKWLAAAEDDLREIASRVALTFGRETAEQTVAIVVEETWHLADFPEIGRCCNEYKMLSAYTGHFTRVTTALFTLLQMIVYSLWQFSTTAETHLC